MDIITKQDIISGFKKIGIEPGMELEVHSSLKSFDYVEGGAITVIEALKETVGSNGSIFMPSLRLSDRLPISKTDKDLGITCKIKLLNPEEEHSAMGLIADTFRQMPEVLTGEGVFRVSAWGRNADKVSQGFQYLLDNGGKALLLGVDIYRLTAMHYVEDLLPQKIRDIFKPSEKVNRIYPPEQWFIETGEPPAKAWYTIQKIALDKGFIKEGQIGKCKCMFFDLWEIVGLYQNELKINPYELYGIEE
jgi:Aminoglycoside N3''-acetyltransferase